MSEHMWTRKATASDMSAALASVAPLEKSCSLPLCSGRKEFQDPGALKSVLFPAGSHRKRARQIMRMFRRLTGHVSCLPSPVNAFCTLRMVVAVLLISKILTMQCSA